MVNIPKSFDELQKMGKELGKELFDKSSDVFNKVTGTPTQSTGNLPEDLAVKKANIDKLLTDFLENQKQSDAIATNLKKAFQAFYNDVMKLCPKEGTPCETKVKAKKQAEETPEETKEE